MMKIYLKTEKVELRLARKNRNQKWLAERMGLSSIYVWQIINRKRACSAFVRDRIMEVFRNVEWDELFEIRNN